MFALISPIDWDVRPYTNNKEKGWQLSGSGGEGSAVKKGPLWFVFMGSASSLCSSFCPAMLG